jgi:ATP-dependent DNA helicase RecQ
MKNLLEVEMSVENPESILRKYFGYDTFRPLQREAIQTLLDGGSCLVLMPTGGGKSLCYQIPALLRPGIALVVSPLIALMKDQVEALNANGIGAAYINSSQTNAAQDQVWADCQKGRIKLLYLAPEKILSGYTRQALEQLPVSLIAIDESHCISSWGHDFRPEYRQLIQIRQWFPQVPVMALTATADRVTRKDILQQLGIPDSPVYHSSFDRPNLSLKVMPGVDRNKQIVDFVKRRPGSPGIVYCLSRRGTESMMASFERAGIKAGYYHAGCTNEHRASMQEAFLRDDIQVMCATIAFGMGIDKSNIRWILHYNIPPNLESFYQEIGRAGRDGMPAETILYYAYGDMLTRMEMIQKSEVEPEQKELLVAKLERMRQYAESLVCRRRVLLSYFNEEASADCGNCDVCLNPRKKTDATIPAQKALSAIVRTGERLSMSSLLDVLRGIHSPVVQENGFQNLPTFGVGRDLRQEIWLDYLLQMLNTGVMDIAYDDGHTFRLNERSWRILKGQEQLALAEPMTLRERRETQTALAPVNPKVEAAAEMFERLRKLRKKLADEEGIPAYQVFSDASLQDMIAVKPLTGAEMQEVQGMSQAKWARFGRIFLREIQDFMLEKQANGVKMTRGLTRTLSLSMYQKGLGVEEIASQRKLSPDTIVQHLIQLQEEGEAVDLVRLLPSKVLSEILEIARRLGIDKEKPIRIQPLLEYFGEQYPTWQLRLAVGIK